MSKPAENESDLEQFRRQWQQEVQARAGRTSRSDGTAPAQGESSFSASTLQTSNASGTSGKTQQNAPPPATSKPADYGWEYAMGTAYHDLDEVAERGRRINDDGWQEPAEPHTALENYEEAEERERKGDLGESVKLYRRAFKLDPEVDKIYKNKHFPPGSQRTSKPQNSKPPNAPLTGPNTAADSLPGLSPSISSLLEDFSNLKIAGAPPPTDRSPPPPCPLAAIPEEILVDIILYTALADLASFARLAQVCKRLAFLVLTEDRVWKRIVCGPEHGFAAMHYRYACDIEGKPLSDDGEGGRFLGADLDWPDAPLKAVNRPSNTPIAIPLTPSFPTYRQMFRTRPRIRFNGCYISTVTYPRAGIRTNTLTWGEPVLVVTYYRYLRFFRDGSCISLQTTTEPRDVVHHLHKENLHRDTYPQGLPGAFMKEALSGRWRLTGPDPAFASSSPSHSLSTWAAGPAAAAPFNAGPPSVRDEREGELQVQTEGSIPKYTFRMQFAFGSAGKGARNNKLNWKGFWSYNTLSDDWAEFGLRNDKAFIWSRVRSYGMGSE